MIEASDYRIVADALHRTVIEEGMKFEGWTAEQIANDLIAFSPTCFEMTQEDVARHVRRWFMAHQEKAL